MEWEARASDDNRCYILNGTDTTLVPIANPSASSDDPPGQNEYWHPKVLSVRQLSENLFVVRLSEPQSRAGAFFALLYFNGEALEWISALMELDDPEILSRWTNAFLGIKNRLYISDIEIYNETVFCVTRGGHATLLAHGPHIENNLVVRYSTINSPAPGFEFDRVDAIEEAWCTLMPQKNYYAVQSLKSNVVRFYRTRDGQEIATTSLTPKQNLGPNSWKRVALAFNGEEMVVCGKDGFNRCALDGVIDKN